MSMSSFGTCVALAILLLIPSYSYATDLAWKILAIDARTKSPVNGASVVIVVTDRNDSNKIIKNECNTSITGNCTLQVKISGSWFSGFKFTGLLSVTKDGYSDIFTVTTKEISETEFETTLSMLSNKELAEQKKWILGEGPSIATYTGLQPIFVFDLNSDNTGSSKERGKFETEQAFTARMATAGKSLIVVPLLTSDKKSCKSNYEHSSQIYSIKNCLAFSTAKPVAIVETEGPSFTLSNAYDSRKIKRILLNEYSISGLTGFIWSSDFNLPPKEAENLEADLMAAVEVEDISVSRSCKICEGRDESDGVDKFVKSLNEITKSSTPIRTDGWKNEAFKSGSITEGWRILVKPKKTLRYFVFRKSDSKILFETRAE